MLEDDDHEIRDTDLAFHEDGTPTLMMLANAIQVWALRQPDQKATVGDAAVAFDFPPATIAEAVNFHAWMFTSGNGALSEQSIEHEGE